MAARTMPVAFPRRPVDQREAETRDERARARLYVARHASDADDLRHLLWLLGLDPADGRIPRRIRLHESPSWRLPKGAVSVAAGTPWANPYRVGVEAADPEHARYLYVRKLRRTAGMVDAARLELAGHELACWCALDDPYCHGDVLLWVAAGGLP